MDTEATDLGSGWKVKDKAETETPGTKSKHFPLNSGVPCGPPSRGTDHYPHFIERGINSKGMKGLIHDF